MLNEHVIELIRESQEKDLLFEKSRTMSMYLRPRPYMIAIVIRIVCALLTSRLRMRLKALDIYEQSSH